MKRVKNRLFWLVIVMIAALASLTACGLPPGYSLVTLNEFGTSIEPGIISLAPPGLVPSPSNVVTATPPSSIIKTPHTLEGRTGYCLDQHSTNGSLPSPLSHIGRPQDSCTVCHQPSWEVVSSGN